MISKPLISVIVPVYNTGSLIHKTIKSILNQTFNDFELILINDGSTDLKTIEICEFYQKNDKRVKLISKENEGIEITRRRGIKLASGEYIVHMDHDDWYSDDALEILYNTASQNNVDIVIANNYRIYSFFRLFNFKLRQKYDLPKLKILSHNEFMDKYYLNFFGVNLYSVSLWAKIYKKSLFDDFEPFCLGYNLIEDIVFNIQTFPLAKNIAIIDDCVYNYRYGGLTSNRNLYYVLEAYSELYKIKQKHIELYNFSKANPFINYEMKNVLQHVLIHNIESNSSFQEIINDLYNFSKSSTYKEMQKFYCKIGTEDSFSKAIIENNFSKMYKIQKKQFETLKFKNKIKRIVVKYLLK